MPLRRARRCGGISPARSSVTASLPPSAKRPLENPADPLAGGNAALLRRARLGGSSRARASGPKSKLILLGRRGAHCRRAGLRSHRLLPPVARTCGAVRAAAEAESVPALRDRHPQRRCGRGEQGWRACHSGERGLRHVGRRARDRPADRSFAPHHAIEHRIPGRPRARRQDGEGTQRKHAWRDRLRRDRPRSGADCPSAQDARADQRSVRERPGANRLRESAQGIRLRRAARRRHRGDREPAECGCVLEDEARRVLHQRLARQPGRRGGARGSARLGTARRLRHGRRPRPGPDADAAPRGASGRDRDAAYRRADGSGDRASSARDRGAGGRDRQGRRPEGRRERRTLEEKTMKTVLITGAAGDVGSHLRRELAGKYALRLSDKRSLKPAKDEKFIRADISKMPDALKITKGVDAIVHLGGYSVEGPWEVIHQANIVGCYNIFEAARRNKVKRILFATSNHAVGFYRRAQVIDHKVYIKPDGRYGVSKVFGEALGSLYADKYSMQVFLMRIGNVNPEPLDKRRLSIWLSPRDLAQLVQIGIDHPDVKFEIVYGVSGNKRSWYDNSNATRLGYRPLDNSEKYAEEILAKEKEGDPLAEIYQGGLFVAVEEVPNPAAPKRGAKK